MIGDDTFANEGQFMSNSSIINKIRLAMSKTIESKSEDNRKINVYYKEFEEKYGKKEYRPPSMLDSLMKDGGAS